MRTILFSLTILLISSCSTREETWLKLWYRQPAETWTEALPVGNGRMGAMVYGGVEQEHIQFNEETLLSGVPRDYSHKGASGYLDEIRQLLFDGKQDEAHRLAMIIPGNSILRRQSAGPHTAWMMSGMNER